MRYKLLGDSGLRVSELGLGAMTFGAEAFGVEIEESRKVYDLFRESGGNFIDTANVYAGGRSEEFLSEFIAGERDRVVLATKFTGPTRSRDVNAWGNSRKTMMEAVDASLKRLGTDFIDLYWIHSRDFMTPIAEVMRGLDDLVRMGKVLYVGVSDSPAWVVAQANTLAEWRGWSKFVGLQIRYSLIDRTVERELMPMAKALDLAVTPWGCVGSGILSGKYNSDPDAEGRAAMRGQISEKSLAIAQEVVNLAEEIGHTPTQVALNWVRQGEGVVVPLVGARNAEQLKDNLGCLDFELTDEQMLRLNEVSQIEMGFPHDMLSMQQARNRKVDNHRA
jgi:aryl-alcohol dehydrogenase-like predicted oxidoreductase